MAGSRHDGEHLDALYSSPPPWDIGRPQPAFLALAGAGAIRGRVLDVGCGTGEHVLMAAGLGLDATGVDLAASALHDAERKAHDQARTARFLLRDARDLAGFGESFDTVLDCGLFHVLDDHERAAYVDGLRAVLVPGGRYLMLCVSDEDAGWRHRVRRDEIAAAFADGWRVDSVEPAVIDVTTDPDGIRAWLVTATRTVKSEARVPTPRGERYARQLCDHAANMNCTAEWTAPQGVIEFPDAMGTCRLTAEPGHLVLTVEATESAYLARIRQIIGRDIERFGGRDGLRVAWS
jgi:hypothetical protein